MRLLLQRRLVGGKRLLGHATLEQHRAIKLARRRQRPRRDRRLLGLVLGIGRRAHGLERVVVLALGVEQPSARSLPLDIDLLGPIGVLGLAQLVAQFGELGDVGLRRLRVARACRAERAGEMRDRRDKGKLGRPDLELGGAPPIPTLDHVTRRTCRKRKGAAAFLGTEVGRFRHIVDDGAGIIVLGELQVGVDHIVLPVQLIGGCLVGFGRTHRGLIGGDRFLPVADAGEDVGRHVLRMRRRGRDLGVTHGRVEAFLGDRRIVVKVDQIVGDAGMLGLALEDRLQDGRAFELIGISLVRR